MVQHWAFSVSFNSGFSRPYQPSLNERLPDFCIVQYKFLSLHGCRQSTSVQPFCRLPVQENPSKQIFSTKTG